MQVDLAITVVAAVATVVQTVYAVLAYRRQWPGHAARSGWWWLLLCGGGLLLGSALLASSAALHLGLPAVQGHTLVALGLLGAACSGTAVAGLRRMPDRRPQEAEYRHFAGVVEGRLRALNEQDGWDDRDFSELEVETERAVTAPIGTTLFARSRAREHRRRGQRRLEPSLTHLLEEVKARVTVLQGDPGSGKSVALRHLALRLAERAQHERHVSIPLYVDLKELRPDGRSVDVELVWAFVLGSVTAGNPAFARFLKHEFDHGVAAGRWLFLFDSFDEIPEVLGATETDQTVRRYAMAIYEFLTTHKCRGVVASREFRGPSTMNWGSPDSSVGGLRLLM